MTDGGAGGTRLRYEPALDGLRAIAVIAVLLFHGGFTWAKGGFLGVSVFFTLSGYLITSLLLAEQRATGSISLGRFWGRRIRRLMPAALACVVLIAVLDARGMLLHHPGLRGDLLASLADVANWRFYFTGQSYGALFKTPSPAQHYWSLAVEEQFYLLLPLAAWWTLSRRRWTTVRMLAGAIVAHLVLTAITVASGWNDPDLAYYATFARAPELLAGVILALIVALVRERTTPAADLAASRSAGTAGAAGGATDVATMVSPSRRRAVATARLAAGAAGFAALAQFAALVIGTDQRSRWVARGGLPAFGISSVALLVAATEAPSIRRWLSASPLQAIGRLSYGLYLYHWPVFLWLSPVRLEIARPLLFVVRLIVTSAIAIVSYVLIERPIRAGTLITGWQRWVALPMATTTSVIAVISLTAPVASAGISVGIGEGVGAASGASGSAATGADAGTSGSSMLLQPAPGDAASPVPTSPAGGPTMAGDGSVLEPASSSLGSAPTAPGGGSVAAGTGPAGSGAAPVTILVAGDSTANALVPGIVAWATESGSASVSADAVRVGCGFVTSGRDRYGTEPREIAPVCGRVLDQLASAADGSHPDVAVVFDGVWEVTDHQAPGDSWRAPGDPVFDRRLTEALRAATDRLLAHVPVVAWATSPQIYPGWGFAGSDPAWDPARMARFNAILASVVASYPERVALIDYAGWFDDGTAGMDAALRPDGVHASPDGARFVADWLGPQLVELVAKHRASGTASTASASGTASTASASRTSAG